MRRVLGNTISFITLKTHIGVYVCQLKKFVQNLQNSSNENTALRLDSLV